MTWTVTRSRTVLRDRWISVRADDCLTSSGVEVTPFYVLEYPDWVHVLALDHADHVIFVRQYRHGAANFSLELPGGMMDPGDTDPLGTGLRELREETGCGGGDSRIVASLSPNPSTHANKLHLVLTTEVGLLGAASPDIAEDLQVERMPYEQALQLATSGAILNAAHVGLLVLGLNAAGRVRL